MLSKNGIALGLRVPLFESSIGCFKGSVLSTYLFKRNFKIDEKFNTKGIQNKGIWNHTAKGYWENRPFLNLPYFTF